MRENPADAQSWPSLATGPRPARRRFLPRRARHRGANRPDFRDFPRGQQQRLLERVNESPAPYRRLVKATYPRMRIKASSEILNGAYGDHLTLHELGHVVANRYFDETDYERFFELFRRSADWRERFETPEGSIVPCVPREEALADQLAFYATGKLEFRSSYDVPPLAGAAAMADTIQASD